MAWSQVQDAATAAGKSPQEFCDTISATFKRVFDDFHISYTDYIRTTEDRHKQASAMRLPQIAAVITDVCHRLL